MQKDKKMKMTLREILEDYSSPLRNKQTNINKIYDQLMQKDALGLFKGLEKSFQAYTPELDKRSFLDEIRRIEFNKDPLYVGDLGMLPISYYFLNVFSNYISRTKIQIPSKILDSCYRTITGEGIDTSEEMGTTQLLVILRTLDQFTDEEINEIVEQIKSNDSTGLFQYLKEVLEANIPYLKPKNNRKLLELLEDIETFTPYFYVPHSLGYFISGVLFLKFFISKLCDQEIKINKKHNPENSKKEKKWK